MAPNIAIVYVCAPPFLSLGDAANVDSILCKLVLAYHGASADPI